MSNPNKGASDIFLQIIRRLTAVAFLLLPLALIGMIGHQIWVSAKRAELIEERDFGYDREELKEDYAGEEIQTEIGTVMAYHFGEDRNLSILYLDEASDFTLVHPESGRQTKITGDDRRVISFKSVRKDFPDPDGEDEDATKSLAVAYVAQLATKEMYAKGVTDIVVGRFSDFQQVVVASNVPYLDAVSMASDEDQFALVFWEAKDVLKRVVFDIETLAIIKNEIVDLPDPDFFELKEDGNDLAREALVIEEAIGAAQR